MSKGFTWPRRTRQSQICLSSSTQAVVGCLEVEECGPGWAGWPVPVAGLVSAPPPSPHQWADLSLHFWAQSTSGHSPRASWGHAHSSCSAPPPHSVPASPSWKVLGDRCLPRPLAPGPERPVVTTSRWLLSPFPFGRGASERAKWRTYCALRPRLPVCHSVFLCAVPSSCNPLRTQGCGASSGPHLFSCRERPATFLWPRRVVCGKPGRGGWRTVLWEGQWLPVPAGGHLCHVPPWSQSPWLLPAAVCQIGSRLLSERRGCLMRRCQTP